MQRTMLAIGWVLAVAAAVVAKDGVATADFAGEWRAGDHTLSVRRDGNATCTLAVGDKRTPQHVGLRVELRIGKEETRWKLAPGKDKDTLVLDLVDGKTALKKLTFTRDKAREAAIARAKDGHKKKVVGALGEKETGHFLFALEEAAPD